MPSLIPSLQQPLGCCIASLLMLTACGGGSEAEGEPPNPPPTLSSWRITLDPQTANGVFDNQSPPPFRASVLDSNAAVSDGTAVVFHATSGTWQVPSAETAAGIASNATLRNANPGALRATAKVQSENGAQTTTSQTLYWRPEPSPIQVLVPSYFTFDAQNIAPLISAAQAYPQLGLTAIINPRNGDFSRISETARQAALAFTQAGGQLLGYVYTQYGERPIDEVKTNIDQYIASFGAGVIRGFFVDEMSRNLTQLAYYQALYQYIQSKGAAQSMAMTVMGNPGTYAPATYYTAADVLVHFEGQANDFAQYDPRRSHIDAYEHSNAQQAALIHNALSCAAMQSSLIHAALPASQIGWLYVTDLEYDYATDSGNPWARLPSYWPTFLASLAAIQAGQPLPACPG